MTTNGSNGSSPDHRHETAIEQIATTNGNGQHYPKRIALPPAPAAAEEKRSLDPGLLWSIFLKWSGLAIPTGLILGAGIAALAWYLHKPTYRAAFPLMIKDKEKVILGNALPSDFVATQRALLRLPVLLNKVLAHKEVGQIPAISGELEPAEWLRGHLEVRQEAASNVFVVTCEMSDAIQAAMVLNALIDEYFDYYFNLESEKVDNALKALKNQALGQRAEVVQQQEAVKKYLQRSVPQGTQIINPFLQAIPSADPKLQALFNQLVLKQVERESAWVELRLEEEAAKKLFAMSPAAVDGIIASMPVIQRLENEIYAYKESQKGKPPGSPAYKTQEDMIQNLTKQLDDSRVSLRKRIKEQQEEVTKAERQRRIEGLNLKVNTLTEQIAALQIEVDKGLEADQKGWPARLELGLAYIDFERAKSRLTKVDDEIWLLELRKQPGPSPVERLQSKADVPRAPVEAIPYKKMAGFSLIGLVLPFGLCVLGEFFTRRLFRSQQIGQEVNLPLLGEVAALPKRPRVPRPGAARRFQRDRSVYEESVDSLRTTLAVCEDLGQTQVLVVASAVSGEGKSTLASRLAFSWARGAGEKVLLIDADLRAPDLHKFFEIDEAPGLGEVLLGEVRSEDAIVDWGHGLHVMPAGRVSMSPHRLFSTPALHELITTARRSYDRVVIDIPPILGAGEALHVAKEADGVLLCARKDISRVPQVKMACHRLELSGARILGCVFIGVASGHYSK